MLEIIPVSEISQMSKAKYPRSCSWAGCPGPVLLNLPSSVAPQVVVTPSHKITSLLPHDCNFVSVMDHSVSI